MTGESGAPCDRFTMLESRQSERLTRCDVCDQAEDVHPNPGRRVLSGGEIEALRRSIIIALYEKQEEERRRHGDNGASSA